MNKKNYIVILFYKFAKVKNLNAFKIKQRKIAESFNLKGRMLIAKEGINATFEGSTKDIKGYEKTFRKQKLFKDVVFKESEGNGRAFTGLQIKIRPEVVTLGAGKLNIKKDTATLITASNLQKMYAKKEDFAVLDLRNDYEIQVGQFENTVNPNLKNFRDLPKKISDLAYLKNEKVVAVCTGGIRCEKAIVLLKKEGFKNIYQLKDGIHTYMKKFPGRHFKGSLFVFDNRMTTSVVDVPNREIIARCIYCNKKCEELYNDDSVRPSKKVICCHICIVRHKNKLRRCAPV